MDSWPITKTLVYSRGAGTVRAVATISLNGVVAVVKNSDWGVAEIVATNWRRA
jgi:hypothetical protein